MKLKKVKSVFLALKTGQIFHNELIFEKGSEKLKMTFIVYNQYRFNFIKSIRLITGN